MPGTSSAKTRVNALTALRSIRDTKDVHAQPSIQTLTNLLCFLRAESIHRAPGEKIMAKGQMRSNKEKKKPKADKNLKKGGAAPVNPFASGKTPAGQSPNSKKS